jgi:hypothetical protein
MPFLNQDSATEYWVKLPDRRGLNHGFPTLTVCCVPSESSKLSLARLLND